MFGIKKCVVKCKMVLLLDHYEIALIAKHDNKLHYPAVICDS